MFGKNDKLSLTFVNARDINGNIFPFQLKLPLSDSEYILPEGLASIDLFEYHEGLVNGGNVVFSIYIGGVTTINNLRDEINKSNVKIAKNIEIESIDSPVCVQREAGNQVVFATINENDVVVDNQEQLMMVVDYLSNNLDFINNSLLRILD